MKIELNKIYCMDCLEGMKQIPDESIDCIITDPPYGIEKEGIKNDYDLWGYNIDFNRILKTNSWLCLYVSIGKIGDVIKIIESNGFRYEWQHITYINNGMVGGRIGFSKYMSCLIFSKGRVKIKERMPDVFECSTSSKQRHMNQHPTPKKVEAIKHLMRCFSSKKDIVLDPFMGSGTTAVACKQLNRDFIGFEINQEYVDIANKRLTQAVLEGGGVKG